MSDWKFAQKDVSEELALLHSYSMKKNQNGRDICFVITVKEFAAPPREQYARFFAQADKFVNQNTAPLLPTGWGNSLLDALCACAKMLPVGRCLWKLSKKNSHREFLSSS